MLLTMFCRLSKSRLLKNELKSEVLVGTAVEFAEAEEDAEDVIEPMEPPLAIDDILDDGNATGTIVLWAIEVLFVRV